MAKVLLVEDDNNLREIYQARLMAEGYDIVAAQNGEEALVVAKQNKPDLIISDVMMPRISGFEMLDILRNTDELKTTKVIMLTALGQAEDQKRASGLGADKYLVKSQVTLEDIVNAAKELLGEDGGVADVPAAPAMPDPITSTPPPPPAEPPAVAPVAPDTPAISHVPEPVVPAPAGPVVAAPGDPVLVAPQPAADPVAPAAATAAAPDSATTQVTPPAVPVVDPPDPAPSAPVISMPTGAEPPVPGPPPADPLAAAAPSAATATAAVADAATQTLQSEEAALQAQIDSYANAPATTPAAANPDEASNTATMASAVEQLNTPVDTPLQPPSAAAAVPAEQPAAPAIQSVAAPAAAPAVPAPASPAAVPADNNNVTVAGKKIIQPISDPAAKPNLDALLAKEEAATPAPPAAPVVNGAAAAAPAPAPAPDPAHLPGQSFDPSKAL